MLAEALEKVQSAIAAEDWRAALTAALTAWREERSSELADLIDRITARCTLPPAPHTRAAVHRWWMANAIAPDPLMIGALLGAWPQRLYVADAPWEAVRTRWAGNALVEAVAAMEAPRHLVQWAARRAEEYVWKRNVANWVERAAAMLTWPDDPRVARVLATLLCDSYLDLEGERSSSPWLVIGDKLRALRDRRIATVIAKASSHTLRDQRQLDALIAEFPVQPVATQLSAIAASVPNTPDLVDRSLELASLWREVGDRPDDDAPRHVLGDALLSNGNNRGELFALQCGPDRAPRHAVQAQRLLKREWDRWFGDVALLLAKRGTEVRRGMLDKIRLGINDTPRWAWDAVAGHHELVAVREVRPAMAPPVAFARLVAALPRFPRMLEIHAHEVVETLLERCANTSLEHVHFKPNTSMLPWARMRPPIETVFEMLSTLAPNLTLLELGSMWWHGGGTQRIDDLSVERFLELVHLLRARFPAAHLRISGVAIREDARADVAAIPGVEVV